MSGGATARGHNGVRVVWRAGASHPETPCWLASDNAVGFIDGTRGELLRVAPDGTAGTRVALAAELGFLADARDGSLFYGSGTSIGRVGVPGAFATVPGDAGRLRLNDAGFDAAGGLWTGTMDRLGQAPLGTVWRIDREGRAEAALEGFTIPNGFALDRAGRTLYVADSPRRVVHALELDRDGRLRARREFASAGTLCEGYPDGMTVDAEDHLWIAFYEGGCLGRFRPDGSLERRVALPVARVTACTFGGEALRTLFVTAGDGLYALEPGVGG